MLGESLWAGYRMWSSCLGLTLWFLGLFGFCFGLLIAVFVGFCLAVRLRFPVFVDSVVVCVFFVLLCVLVFAVCVILVLDGFLVLWFLVLLNTGLMFSAVRLALF